MIRRLLPSLLLLACGCARRSFETTAEARALVERAVGAAVAYANGHRGEPRFPMSSSQWTPRGDACAERDHRLPVDAEGWQLPPWIDLHVEIAAPSAWQLRAVRTGSGPREHFLVEARADRNCDGVFAHLALAVGADGKIEPLTVERADE